MHFRKRNGDEQNDDRAHEPGSLFKSFSSPCHLSIDARFCVVKPQNLSVCFTNLFSVFAGAIFTEDQKDSPMELAFKYAVYRINKDKNMLPKTTLVYDIQYVPKDDSFRTSKKGMHRSFIGGHSDKRLPGT